MQTFKIYTRAIITDSDCKILLLKKNSSQKYWAWNFLLPWWTLEFWEDLENDFMRWTLALSLLSSYIENLSDLKNMEPEKHEFCWFLDYKEIELFDKDLIEKYFFNK